jgi:hypothetical protein
LGRLVARENRSSPRTNLIELAFVRLKSTAEKPGYPVVYLDGGPGSSAISRLASEALPLDVFADNDVALPPLKFNALPKSKN